MEAILFKHYLETQTLMTIDEARSSMPTDIMLIDDDYCLGMFDMTGELMRFTINFMAFNQTLPEKAANADDSSTPTILQDMQNVRAHLETMNVGSTSGFLGKDWDSKLRVTKQSVEKVENGVYSMLVRGKERPRGWRPDEAPRELGVESY